MPLKNSKSTIIQTEIQKIYHDEKFQLQVLVVGGITTLFAALFGFYVTMREDSCLMITYAVIMAIEFLVMVTGIVCTVDLLFIIQTGLFDSDVIPELTLYETDSWVRHKWDTMQRKFNLQFILEVYALKCN